nr:hypothetical protein [Tanacetum cinerariifolium]
SPGIPVITPFHDDPYVLVRQAYTPIATEIKSEPFENPIETEETHPLSHRASPLSPDYTPASLDYTPDTPHTDEELETIEASETRTASPSDSIKDTESEESEDESTDSESEEAAFENQQPAISVEGQSSRSVPDQQAKDETPTPSFLICPTWVDPEDSSVCLDIEFDPPSRASARQSDAQRAAMWQARYKDHRLIHDLLVQNGTTQHELQELRDRVTALEQERSRKEE